MAIYAHPSNPAATGMALTPDVAELAITSSSAGHSQQNRRQSLAGTLTEVVRLRPEQLMAAIEDCLPVHWPPGGLLDAFLLVVLEPHQKEMKIAVDATFTKPFGVEAEEEPPQDEPEQGCDAWQVIFALALSMAGNSLLVCLFGKRVRGATARLL